MTSLLSSTITAVSNHLKPHRAEALQRIRLNGLCLITTLIASYLLPIPSLLTAVRILLTSSHHHRWSTEWIYEWVCIFGTYTLGLTEGENRLLVFFFSIEMVIITIFAYNILEATYAVKYPRAPLRQTTPSAATRSKSGVATSPTPKRAFKVLSPNVRLFNLTCTLKFSNHFFYCPTCSPALNRRNLLGFLRLLLLLLLPSLFHPLQPIPQLTLNLLSQLLRG
jgi:hypothetical protein